MERHSQKGYWDVVAAEKNFTLLPDFRLLETNIDREAFILDYGCGYGRTLDELYHAGYRNTLGLDFLMNEDERNKKRYATYADKYGVAGVFDLPEGVTLRHHDESYVKLLMKDFAIIHFEKTVNRTMNGHISNGFVLMAQKERGCN